MRREIENTLLSFTELFLETVRKRAQDHKRGYIGLDQRYSYPSFLFPMEHKQMPRKDNGIRMNNSDISFTCSFNVHPFMDCGLQWCVVSLYFFTADLKKKKKKPLRQEKPWSSKIYIASLELLKNLLFKFAPNTSNFYIRISAPLVPCVLAFVIGSLSQW